MPPKPSTADKHRNGRGQHAVAIEQRQPHQGGHADRGLGRCASTGARCASAASAITPPSPLLSARMMKPTYLTVTTTTSAQKISDRAP